MSKNKIEKPQREMTKRQLSHWQRENRLQRIVMLAGVIVIAAVLIIVGTGLYMNKFKPLGAVVIKVGNTQNQEQYTDYSMDYYIDALVYHGMAMGPQYLPMLTDYVAQSIQQNSLIVQAAAGLGITVSDDEVKNTLKEREISANQARMDAVRAELVIEKLRTDYFEKQLPETAEHRAFLAMFLESEEQVKAVEARLAQGESFQDVAAELSLEAISKEKSGDFGWMPKDVLDITIGNSTLTEKVFGADVTAGNIFNVEEADLSKPVGYWLLKVTEKDESTQKVHLYGILLPSEQKAKEIKAQLDGGADFVELAKTNSLYTDAANNGGDFGLISKGAMGEAVDKVVFPDDTAQALAQNTVSDPVKDADQVTKGGYWLVQVTGIEDQKVEGNNREIWANNLLMKWADKVWTDNKERVQNLLTDEQKQYAVEQAQSR